MKKDCFPKINVLCHHYLIPAVFISQVPDYYDLVKNPMDFSGIRNRINKYEYSDAIVIVNDVRQIFINCEQYNRKGTQEFKAGSNLSKFFEKKVKDLHLNDSQDPNPRQGKKMKKL